MRSGWGDAGDAAGHAALKWLCLYMLCTNSINWNIHISISYILWKVDMGMDMCLWHSSLWYPEGVQQILDIPYQSFEWILLMSSRPFMEVIRSWSKNLEIGVIQLINWVVVSIFINFHPYLGKWSNLTNIFQRGWNHQLVKEILLTSWYGKHPQYLQGFIQLVVWDFFHQLDFQLFIQISWMFFFFGHPVKTQV